jgi:transcriptional regulator with XRE-family HTH domain
MLTPSQAIGARLRAARLQAGLTQQHVATDFLCSRQAVSSWERGSTLPSLLQFGQLLALYAASADDVLYGDDTILLAGQDLIRRASRQEEPPRFVDTAGA